MKPEHNKAKTSQQFQQEYMDASLKLGQAIFQEEEALKLQEEFREAQAESAKGFKAAQERERLFAAQQAEAAKKKAEFEAKNPNKASEAATPTDTPPNDAGVTTP